MIFRNRAQRTESIHRSVTRNLDRIDRIYVKSCQCIGNTINGRDLEIWINPDNRTTNLCDPIGTSLFRMECTIPTYMLNYPKNQPLKMLSLELFNSIGYISVLPTAMQMSLKIDAYFVVPAEERSKFCNIMQPFFSKRAADILPIFYIGKMGTFALCRPRFIYGVPLDSQIPFNEFKALSTLGGLEDAVFHIPPLTPQEGPAYDIEFTEECVVGDIKLQKKDSAIKIEPTKKGIISKIEFTTKDKVGAIGSRTKDPVNSKEPTEEKTVDNIEYRKKSAVKKKITTKENIIAQNTRYFSVDYTGNYKIKYDSVRKCYAVDTLPTDPIYPDSEIEDDVFTEEHTNTGHSHQHHK
ncbi:DUF3023 domain-containing protein [Ehrlichia ruminantium]|uniref:DUF3023 domain-containing protein n=1 Tax=Ehrlichia ruminantium TaxID=779 RepID=A0AAE6QAD2_EHRRU|nr:DUF3023 domain-containing protein [Ehrlichia ruminantium]QGR02620.1 DUF3023 domain-containing protein [Ehrlichia ruminantium]QGR03540.1 DUF3023 domain-containing protein [Ehrlichia ruminantium]QGR04467.1 DUF3023 domain-containing protein [Ehrlichia ruminantium]